MKATQILGAVLCIGAASAGYVPKLPAIPNIYRPPAPRPAGVAPRPTIYRPPQTRDLCAVGGALCSTTPTAVFETATASATGCASTDGACLNCAMAYQSQYDAASYDPQIFQSPYEDQAAALCYQATIWTTRATVYTSLFWAPGYYDIPYSYCEPYFNSIGDTYNAYWATYFQGFCSGMGDVVSVSSVLTGGRTIVAARATGTNVATGGAGGAGGTGGSSSSGSSSSGTVSNGVSNVVASLFTIFAATAFLCAMFL